MKLDGAFIHEIFFPFSKHNNGSYHTIPTEDNAGDTHSQITITYRMSLAGTAFKTGQPERSDFGAGQS